MAFKLLLTENQSALGKAICQGLEDYPYEVVCPPADGLAWLNPPELQDYLTSLHPSMIINTLAYTGADAAASQCLAKACSQQRRICLHLSSYRVFGTAKCPDKGFDESDLPAPEDEEGQQLLAAEQAFLELDKAVILRLPWLIDAEGDNLFTRVASRLASGQTLVASDIWQGSPVSLDHACRVVTALILQILCDAENWGVFHLHSSDSCSEAEFADAVARLLEKEGQTAGEIDIQRDQPEHLVPGCGLLRGKRCMNNFGIQFRSWRQGLPGLVQEWVRGL